ncbi:MULTISPECIES: peptidoglycan-binding domain-containing protein [Clostridium]|uniref:Peptidoglycan binding-like domain-containing protein n=1 Tax=Clostridium novyi B str. ATCC 27606 TaxID=1443123 RepID=A0AA40IRF8_CLONO|nr:MULTISPECIES: peptidoglycan-binding domain-containing protein [Clostridium]KEI07974.1 hypothetical protein Z958_p0161 [Clostridium novyi B str. NCTC 9691]KEI11398.1 hypothetical protein Z959_p0101 [Clostridium novyi B str. ATCC 27606]OOB74992.1 hypothetical protein AXF41_13575 [Clostridium haemolyticum]
MLKQGDRGANVSKLQKTLKYLGYSCGKIDGIFGESTKNQVKRFQRHNGLPANGIVDVVTEKSLDYAINVEYKLAHDSNHSGFTELLGLSFHPYEWFLGGHYTKSICRGRIEFEYKYGIISKTNTHGTFNLNNFDFRNFSISSDSSVKASLNNISSKLGRLLRNKYNIDDVSFSSGSVSIDTSGISIEGVKISNKRILGPYEKHNTKSESLAVSGKIPWSDIGHLTEVAAIIVGLCVIAACAPAIAATVGIAAGTLVPKLNQLCAAI